MHNEVSKVISIRRIPAATAKSSLGRCISWLCVCARIKNFAKCQLYAFQKRKGYEQQGYKILPDAYIKPELLADQWTRFLRCIATIKLKEATASQLFKRLNSSSRQHPLYHASKSLQDSEIGLPPAVYRHLSRAASREKQLNKAKA